MASSDSRSGAAARRRGTERNSISGCPSPLAPMWSPHHVALLLNVTYRFPYRRVTKNEPSSVLKILRRARHTNRGSLLFPVSCLTRALIFLRGIPGTFYAPAVRSRRSGNNQFAVWHNAVQKSRRYNGRCFQRWIIRDSLIMDHYGESND